MKLRAKLFLAMSSSILILIVQGGVNLYFSHLSNESINKVLKFENARTNVDISLGALSQLTNIMKQLEAARYDDETFNLVSVYYKEVLAKYEALKQADVFNYKEHQKVISLYADLITQYGEAETKFQQINEEFALEIALFMGDAVNNLIAELNILRVNFANQLKDAVTYQQSIQTQPIYAGIFIFIVLTILTFLMAWLFTGRLLKNIYLIVNRVNAISNGTLNKSKLKVNGSDELTYLANNISTMEANLLELVKNITDTSHQLRSASNVTLQTAKNVHEGSSEQNIEMQSASSAMNEMTITVEEISKNAAEAFVASNETAKSSEKADELVSEVKDVINTLASEVQVVTTVILELEKSSENINTILDVINGISQQTNLLALNAAIEAARAGEQGRGFAVVADEVRTLAGRTHDATQEIAQMIHDLRVKAHSATQAMLKSKELTDATVSKVLLAREQLNDTCSAVDRINGMNTTIASASEEQSCVARDINSNMSRISQLASVNSENSMKITEVCESLAKLANDLKDIVSKFSIKD